MMRIDINRARCIGSALGKLKRYAGYIYRVDPQFWAVTSVVDGVDLPLASTSIVGNALVSYRLSMRGESYWSLFSKRVVENPISASEYVNWFSEFLGRYNRINYRDKVRRIVKFSESRVYNRLLTEPLAYCNGLLDLNEELGREFRDSASKTVVFATKMYLYTCIACGASAQIDQDIPIPVDRRIALLTARSKLVSGCSSESDCASSLVSNRSLVIDAWNLVSRISGVPPILIDTFAWILLGRDIEFSYSALGKLSELFSDEFASELVDIVRDVLKCAAD